ncbi:MAG: hypothetical protein ABSE16_21105 [Verrucomicrobiota bacterium]
MKMTPIATQICQTQFHALWPALKGSLARVYKPCIRKNCAACARGDKHPAWLLSFTQHGRRRCLYVPLTLVPAIRPSKTGENSKHYFIKWEWPW